MSLLLKSKAFFQVRPFSNLLFFKRMTKEPILICICQRHITLKEIGERIHEAKLRRQQILIIAVNTC
jgi:Mn-dependent DtxR family transcriptional regulator